MSQNAAAAPEIALTDDEDDSNSDQVASFAAVSNKSNNTSQSINLSQGSAQNYFGIKSPTVVSKQPSNNASSFKKSFLDMRPVS